MLHVDLDHILTQETALSHIQDIFSQVESSGEIYLVTAQGKPAIALMNIEQLEQLTGKLNTPTTETMQPAIEMPMSTPVQPEPELTPAPEQPQTTELPSMPFVEDEPVPAYTTTPTEPPMAPSMTAATVQEPAMETPIAPPPTNLPPLSGIINLPDELNSDPRNSSPLS